MEDWSLSVKWVFSLLGSALTITITFKVKLLMYMQAILACPGKIQINWIPVTFYPFCIVKLETLMPL